MLKYGVRALQVEQISPLYVVYLLTPVLFYVI